MKRVEIDNAILYQGDCLEVMATIEKRVDAVITDPPYGIGFQYNEHDDKPENYGAWLWERIEKAESLCSEGSPVFVWQAMLNVKRFSEWFPRDWRIFAAAKNFIQIRPTPMQYAYDPVVVWWTDGNKWRSEKTKGDAARDFHIANTAGIISDTSRLEKEHPCPRPLDQVAYVIRHWVRPEGVIIDPFMGSGTTGVACAKLGHKFIGIEIDPKYFELACKRLEEARKQPSLWVA